MIYFIPAWYQQNTWCENEQNWHARRTRSEFDDTVKHIQLFHRNSVHPFQVMLLSFAPNFRHFLHRQSVFHVSYWSCFDAIQEIRRKKVMMFSFHNLNWPEHIEFVYTPFVVIANLHGEKYAQIEFGEDGNPIEIDMFCDNKIIRRNIYDDRGFVSSSIVYENEKPRYQDYLNDKGTWKLRYHFSDGHVEVNPKNMTYIIQYEEEEYSYVFSQRSYKSMNDVIAEVVSKYVSHTNESDMFCVAMHKLHTEVLKQVLADKKTILSFYMDRYELEHEKQHQDWVESADYIITDSKEQMNDVKNNISKDKNIVEITPFDSRVDFGISQQLSVQKIMVPVDGLGDARFEQLIIALGNYILSNKNARIILFTRVADYGRKNKILERTRECLAIGGLEVDWATEESLNGVAENDLRDENRVPVKFFVEQCVDELSVSKCIREQRIMLDMRTNSELYLRITGISVGIPQILYTESQFVEHGKNGFVIKEMAQISECLAYYLDSLKNWNEALIYSYEIGKKYTTEVLVNRWKEVIDFVSDDTDITVGN